MRTPKGHIPALPLGVSVAKIPGSPGYWASTDGRIYSTLTNRFLALTRSGTTGRLQGSIRVGTRFYKRDAHRLVCLAWHGPQPAGMVASHRNGNSEDNSTENLCWETQAENLARREQHGTGDRGLANSRAAVTHEQVLEIRRLRVVEGRTQECIAQRIGVSRTTVLRILNGQRYQDVA